MNKLHLTFTLIISGIIFHSHSMITQENGPCAPTVSARTSHQTFLEIIPYKTTAEILKTGTTAEHHLYELSTKSKNITKLIEQRDACKNEMDRLENLPKVDMNPTEYFLLIGFEKCKQRSLNERCWTQLDACKNMLVHYNNLCLENKDQTEFVQKSNDLSITFARQTINVFTFIIDNALCTEEWFTQLDINKEFINLFWKEFYDSIEHLPQDEREKKIWKKYLTHCELEKYNKNFSFMPKGLQENLIQRLQTLTSKKYDITPEQADQLRKKIENDFSRPIDQNDKTKLLNQLNRIVQEKEFIKKQLFLHQPATQAGIFLNKVSQLVIPHMRLIGFNPDVIKDKRTTQPNKQKPKKTAPSQWSWLKILMSSIVVTLPATIFALTKLFFLGFRQTGW